MGVDESRNLWISVGAGLFATFMLYSYTQEKKAELDKTVGDKITVVVAKEDIRYMDTILDDVVEIKEKLRADAEPDAIRSTEELIGTVAAIPIKKGQTITKNKLTEPGPETGMALQVSLNRRAVTIPVGPQNSNAGLIRPGDRVDVFAVLEIGKGAAARREALLFRENILVLATGVSINNNLPRTIEKDPSGTRLVQTTLTGDTKYGTLTVEVDVNDAQDLIFLVSNNPSSLFLVLRNPYEKAPVRPRYPASNYDTILANRGPGAVAPTNNQSSGFSPQGQPNLNNGQRPPGN